MVGQTTRRRRRVREALVEAPGAPAFRGPFRSRVTASRPGVSVSRRFGPFTVSFRGHVTLRILPGVSPWIF